MRRFYKINRNHMKLIKWEPLNELDRFFEPLTSFPKLGLDLAVDVYEEKDMIVAKMNLPGIHAQELDISLEDDVLTVSGRREEEKETEKKDYYSKEIRRGSFTRSVRLPKSVDAPKAEATYEHGELRIVIPIIAGTKEKAVKVKIKK
jgi:HSP20 family protein